MTEIDKNRDSNFSRDFVDETHPSTAVDRVPIRYFASSRISVAHSRRYSRSFAFRQNNKNLLHWCNALTRCRALVEVLTKIWVKRHLKSLNRVFSTGREDIHVRTKRKKKYSPHKVNNSLASNSSRQGLTSMVICNLHLG